MAKKYINATVNMALYLQTDLKFALWKWLSKGLKFMNYCDMKRVSYIKSGKVYTRCGWVWHITQVVK